MTTTSGWILRKYELNSTWDAKENFLPLRPVEWFALPRHRPDDRAPRASPRRTLQVTIAASVAAVSMHPLRSNSLASPALTALLK